MAITKEKKGQILKDLEEKFSKAKSVYFAENKGMAVKDVTMLRSKLHEKNVDFIVAKKTLMKLAAKNQNLPEVTDEVLTGPIAAIIGYDEDTITPSKIVKDFGDTIEKKVILTGGILDGKLISQAEAVELASLPSKQQLLARLVGSMKSPLTGFYMVIKGLSEKSPATEAKAEVAAEAAPAAEATASAEPAAENAPGSEQTAA
ncbi:MAG: 50S ribosomal protein L10 [Candidatus Altimarinota bacterium]